MNAINTDYDALYTCYITGQISAAQWQEHLKDEVFAAWVRKREKQR